MPRHFLGAALATLAALAAAAPDANAQAYPVKPIKLVVPFAPGGGSDFIGRFIAQRLSGPLKQQVIVENKPGAGGLLGIEYGVTQPSDGYTLMLIASSYTVNPSIYKLKFDPLTDITPIIQLSSGPLLIVATPSLAAKNVAELIALAKARPGRLNYASSGQGSVIHMATELFQSMAGVKMNHVPYKGTGPALTDTISGTTDVFFSSTATALPQVQGGKLKALGVTTAKRLPALPAVGTVAEAGVTGYDVILWHGLIGPRNLPKAVVDTINREALAILKSGDTAKQLEADGVAPAGGTPQEFLQTIRTEIELWRKVAKEANVKAE